MARLPSKEVDSGYVVEAANRTGVTMPVFVLEGQVR